MPNDDADQADLLTGTPDRLLPTMLDVQRGEVRALLDDLDETEARRRLVPSLTTLLGLVQHATFVEKVWFHTRVGDRTRGEVGIGETVEESFVVPEGRTIAEVVAEFDETCAASRRYATDRELDERFDWRGREVSLAFIYAHCIQELARHCGHGDILREQVLAARSG